MTWPLGRAPEGPAVDLGTPELLAATPGPVPSGRGRWRLLLLARQFADQAWGISTMAELASARSRRLEINWNQPAKLSFTVDGRSDAAAATVELMTDVLATRWDETQGLDIPMFRGIVSQSQDDLSEQAHSVNFVCQDYSAVLARRLITSLYSVTQKDQDYIVQDLITIAKGETASNGTSFGAGSYLPLSLCWVNPDGSTRANPSGTLRDRTYTPSTEIGQTFTDLAAVIGGFDFDVLPIGSPLPWGSTLYDRLRIFYPYQGVTRSAPALVYGSTVSTVSRSVNSADYANYWRVIGNNGSSDPNVAQLYAEAWSADANNVTSIPIGLWMGHDDAADVSIQSTLNDKAQGDLALNGIVVPTYTLGLRPGAYTWGNPNIGDVVTLVVKAGRLNVNTTVRVLGITYDIGDDGQEDIALTVGRPVVTLPQLLKRPVTDTAALTRR